MIELALLVPVLLSEPGTAIASRAAPSIILAQAEPAALIANFNKQVSGVEDLQIISQVVGPFASDALVHSDAFGLSSFEGTEAADFVVSLYLNGNVVARNGSHREPPAPVFGFGSVSYSFVLPRGETRQLRATGAAAGAGTGKIKESNLKLSFRAVAVESQYRP